MSKISLTEISTPDTPSSGILTVYAKTGGTLACKNDEGTEVILGTTNTFNDIIIASSQTVNITTVNAATYDLLDTDYILNIIYTNTGAVTSLTLPTAQVIDGRIIKIKDAGGNAGTNNITIDTEGAETIDGATSYVINVDYESISLYSDGSNWLVY